MRKRKQDEPFNLEEPKKVLSCQRCRVRKIKCSFESPCASCIKAEVECIQTVDDMRKKRPPVNYVTSLEKKIQNLTGFLRTFDGLDNMGKQVLLEKTNLDNLIVENSLNGHESSVDLQETSLGNVIDTGPEEDRAIYGPTSVYDDNLISKTYNFKRVEESLIKFLNNDPDILHCVKLFFTWQYPDHNMFIFREAFLIDFFNPQPSSLYCSKILILSICALGSRMSDNERIYERSVNFYTEAKSILLNQLSSPSITSLQSFLLLAFYDICNGNNSSGWMLSGNAMRMGFDMGFQLNPEVWFVKSKEDLSPLDVDIRSRIYWGSYVADHFISLLLGRPSLLKDSDATIPETNDLPDLEWIDDYTYSGMRRMQANAAGAQKGGSTRLNINSITNGVNSNDSEPLYISNPLKKIINLISISDNMLNDIFTKSDLENESSNHEDLNLISRLEKLYEYNAQIQKWRNSLPPDLQWDRESLKETAEDPTLSCIRYYYYILILCLNRPFVGIFKKALAKLKTSSRYDDSLSPLKMCSDAIEDVIEAVHQFESVHGFRRVSIFMVYCSILSISVLLLTNTSKQLMQDNKDYLQFFLDVLQGSSKTWKLAEKSYNLISVKLKNAYEEAEEEEEELEIKEFKVNEVQFTNQNQNTPNHQPSSQSFLPLPLPQVNSPYGALYEPKFNHDFHTHQRSPLPAVVNRAIVESNTDLLFDKTLDFLGGPPVLMTSDLFSEDWASLFPDYMSNPKNEETR